MLTCAHDETRMISLRRAGVQVTFNVRSSPWKHYCGEDDGLGNTYCDSKGCDVFRGSVGWGVVVREWLDGLGEGGRERERESRGCASACFSLPEIQPSSQPLGPLVPQAPVECKTRTRNMCPPYLIRGQHRPGKYEFEAEFARILCHPSIPIPELRERAFK